MMSSTMSWTIRKENVAQIITFGKMQARAVIRDVGGHGDSLRRGRSGGQAHPATLNITLEQALEQEPRLRELMDKDSR